MNLNVNGPDFVSIAGASNQLNNPDLEQPLTRETTASFQHELVANTSVNLTYVHKTVADQFALDNILRPSALFNVPIVQTDPGPDGVVGNGDDGGPVTIWDYPAAYRGAAFVGNKFVNSDRDDSYHSIEGTVTRRFADKWSALWSIWATKSYRWLNLIRTSPNDDMFPLDETWSWQMRANGIYQLPYGLQVSGTLRSQQGLAGQRTVTFRNIPSQSTVTMRMEPLGAQRSQTIHVINMRFTKRFDFKASRRLDINFEVFNLPNSSVPVGSTGSGGGAGGGGGVNYLSGPAFGFASLLMPARVARLGGQFSF